MSRFLVLFSAPAAVIDEWMKTPAEKRKEAEEKMMQDWKNWMADHAKFFVDKGAGVGKTKRVTAQGVADTRNDLMREHDLVAFRDACWYSWSALTASLAKLADCRFEWLLPGHGWPIHLPADEMNTRLLALVARMREG